MEAPDRHVLSLGNKTPGSDGEQRDIPVLRRSDNDVQTYPAAQKQQ